MKNEDIMKYVLGAGAVYLLYLWAEEQGWLEGLLQPPQPQFRQPVELPEDVAAPSPAPPPPPVGVTQESLEATAQQGMGASWDGKLTADQWNHYYTQLSGVLQTTDLFPPGDRGYLMTVAEYWQQRQQAGLNALARLPAMSAWTN